MYQNRYSSRIILSYHCSGAIQAALIEPITAADDVLEVTVLECVRESRHIMKTRCSCLPPGPAVAFIYFNEKISGDTGAAAGARLQLRKWRSVEVPNLALPLLLCTLVVPL